MKPKHLFVALLIVLAVTLTFTLVDAQGPKPKAPTALAGTAFTYQGQLKQNGALLNGSCDFQFGLWDDALTGPQYGATQTISGLAVTNGLFTTPIDFGGGTTNYFTGTARYLASAVRCPAGGGSYTALNPRETLTPAPYAFALPGLFTQPNSTSPNVVGGYSGNRISVGVTGAAISGGGRSGNINSITADYGAIGGGYSNTLSSGTHSTIGGGNDNTAQGFATTIGGGSTNTVTISADGGTVGGGEFNRASNAVATVAGGLGNTASGVGSFVGGGGYDNSSVSGNVASGNASTIPGGFGNSATMNYSFAAGNQAHAVNQGAFVWGDSTNAAVSSNLNDQFVVRASAGVRIIRGTSVFSTTSTALQAENATTYGEAAWLRLGSISNTVSVVSLIKQSGGTGNFLQCYNESGLTETSTCHINSAGSFVSGSDFAESLSAVGDKSNYAPGDVLIISASQPGGVEKSSHAFDRAVIGVYSTRPGFIGADKNGTTQVNADEIPVAITGIVPVKVTLENGAIRPGDLLATSSTLGQAMNAGANPPIGTVIGKAMGTLDDAQGVILMLVTLR